MRTGARNDAAGEGAGLVLHAHGVLLRRVPGAWVERNRVMMRGCDDALYLIDGMPVTPLGDETATEAVNSCPNAGRTT